MYRMSEGLHWILGNHWLAFELFGISEMINIHLIRLVVMKQSQEVIKLLLVPSFLILFGPETVAKVCP